jgi:hypothetical protein
MYRLRNLPNRAQTLNSRVTVATESLSLRAAPSSRVGTTNVVYKMNGILRLFCIGGLVLLLPSCATQLVDFERMCMRGLDELRERGVAAEQAKHNGVNFSWSVSSRGDIDLERKRCA